MIVNIINRFVMIISRRVWSMLGRGEQLRFGFALLRFPLPDLGEKIKQGKVKKLYIKEGDHIKEFQKIADVESDKQFTEITSPEEGVIKKLYYYEDQTCMVGDIFLEIETNKAQTHHQHTHNHTQVQHESTPATAELTKSEAIEGKDEVLASSTVKLWAKQNKINLNELKGTGRKGRVLKDDIIHFLQNRDKPVKVESKQEVKQIINKTDRIKKVQMSTQEKQAYKLAAESITTPHLYYQQTFDVSEAVAIAKKANISLLSILIKTFSLALKGYPKMNSTYSLSNPFVYTTHSAHNILLPSLTNPSRSSTLLQAETLSIDQIQSSLQTGKNAGNFDAATIAVSNIGSLGSFSINPIIYGQISCHASIGALRKVPAYKDGALIDRQVIQITMGCDHRVLDGATVARFTTLWREYSQSPLTAFLTMV